MTPLLIAIGAIIALIFILTIMYNSLIGKKNQVENAFAGIDVQLKKRFDLIPNLVASVEKYMSHEKSLLVEVTALRTKAASGDLSPDEKVALDNQISHAMSGINIAVENYPDLKSHESFRDLNSSMNEIEGQISAARRAYNASVTEFNDAIQMIPTNIIAGFMRLSQKELFQANEQERENVNVKELFES